MKKTKRVYNTQKEWTKDIKFNINNHWYRLKSIYDDDLYADNFDFNDVLYDANNFDFNVDPEDPYNYEVDLDSVIYHEPDFDDMDFNTLYESNDPLGGQFNFGDIINSTYKEQFLEFAKYINSKGSQEQFNISAGICIKDQYGNIIANEDSDLQPQDSKKMKDILGTILIRGGGYSNEAVLQMIMNQNKNKIKPDSILSYLNKLYNANIPGLENRFPDAYFGDKKSRTNANAIPIDLKVSYNGNYNASSASNRAYMTGIYAALLNAIKNNQTLLEFIKNSEPGVYHKNNYTNYTWYKIGNNIVMPELKGFILYSKTIFNKETKTLIYKGFEICPIIASMKCKGWLFPTKEKNGLGAVSYYRPDYNIYNEQNSILNGLPFNFALTIKNFYDNILSKSADGRYYADFDKVDNGKNRIENISLIKQKIAGEEYKISNNDDKIQNESIQYEEILAKYDLINCFKFINENDDTIKLSNREQLEIQNSTAQTLENIEKIDKSKALIIGRKLKQVFQKHGKNAFISACIALALISGNASISLARSMERINFNDDRPMDIIDDIIPGGGIEFEKSIIAKFIHKNFNDQPKDKIEKIEKEINKELSYPNRIILLTKNYIKLHDLEQEILNDQNNFTIIKYYVNKNHPNKNGKYQALVIAEY